MIGPVNWGAYEGSMLERLMAVYVAQEHPATIRREPASGDGGIDLLIPDGAGYRVDQIKGFALRSMGFLDRAAMKAERRRLAPFFLPDERFIQSDVLELLTVEFQSEGTRLPGGKVAFTLTSKVVYFRRTEAKNPDVARIPYERIVAVDAANQLLTFTTFSGGDDVFEPLANPWETTRPWSSQPSSRAARTIAWSSIFPMGLMQRS